MSETLRLVINGSSKGAQKALDDLNKKAKNTETALDKVKRGLSKPENVAAVGFAALTGVIVKSVSEYEKFGAQVRSTQRALGADAGAASTLIGQWKRYNVESGAATMATKTLSKAIDEARNGNATYAETFDRLGISVEQLQSMSDTEAIFATRDALGELEAGAARTHIATQLLGRGAMSMSNWYSQSATDMAETNKLLQDSGLIWDDAQVRQYAEAAKAQAELRISMAGIAQTIARDVVPAMTPMVEAFGDLLQFMRPISPVLIPLTIGLGTFVAVVKTANALSGAWGQTFAKLLPKIGATTVAETVETEAIVANTVAVEANTTAKQINGKVVSSWSGTGFTAASGAGGLGVAGTAAVAAVPVAIVASTVLLTHNLNQQEGMEYRGVDPATGKPVNVGTRRRGRGGTNDPSFQSLAESNLELRASLSDSILASHSAEAANNKAAVATDEATQATDAGTAATEDNTAATEASTAATKELWQMTAAEVAAQAAANVLTQEQLMAMAVNADAAANPWAYKQTKKGWVQTAAITANNDMTGLTGADIAKLRKDGIPGYARGGRFRTRGLTIFAAGEGSTDEVVDIRPAKGAGSQQPIIVNNNIIWQSIARPSKAEIRRLKDELDSLGGRELNRLTKGVCASG